MLFMSEEYELYITYNKSENTYDVFRNVSTLMFAIDGFNNAISSSFGDDIETQIEIADIQSGSIRLKLKDTIKSMPDDKIRAYIKDPREIIIDILISFKYKFMTLLDEDSTKIEAELPLQLEQTINDTRMKDYGYTIHRTKLLTAASSFSQSSKMFKEAPRLTIKNTKFDLKASYMYDVEKDETIRKQVNKTRQKFMIKKPDIVGDSKWTIIFDKNIDVNILDKDWIKKLRNRDFSISHGDMLDADLRIETFIDEELNPIETHYYVDVVHGIVQ